MIKRVVWFAIGAGVGIYALYKVRSYLQQASPEALGHRVTEAAGGLTDTAREFIADVRAGMVEREADLRDALGLPQPDSDD